MPLVPVLIALLALAGTLVMHSNCSPKWYLVENIWSFIGCGLMLSLAVPIVGFILCMDGDDFAICLDLCVVIHAVYPFLSWFLERYERRKIEDEIEDEKRKQEEEYWRYAERTLGSLPDGTGLFFDTCVLMSCEENYMKVWFKYLMDNVRDRNWQIVFIKPVINELDNMKQKTDGEKAARARAAGRLIRSFTTERPDCCTIIGENLRVGEIADDMFHLYMDGTDVLFTTDNIAYAKVVLEHEKKAEFLKDPILAKLEKFKNLV